MRGKDEKTAKRARSLRQSSTCAEALLWSRVRDRRLGGFKFVRQEPIGRYYPDFVCRERRLIVEVDGGQHAEGSTERRRDAVLAALDYRVIRFWNNEVVGNIDGVLQALLVELRRQPLTPTLSPQAGRGSRAVSSSAGPARGRAS